MGDLARYTASGGEKNREKGQEQDADARSAAKGPPPSSVRSAHSG